MNAKIIVTGATGVVGRRAVAELLAAGHEVKGVARSERARRVLRELEVEAAPADVYDAASLARAFAGSDVVVNLLTRIPPVARAIRPSAWRENDRLRREASRAVASAAHSAGAGRLVQESIVLVYATGGDRRLDEDSPLAPAGPPAGALVAERHAAAFAGDTVVLRFGLFLGPDSDQTQAAIAQARHGLSASMARRDAFVPTLWLDDAGRAVAAAIGAPAGTYNVADDEPPRRHEIDAALAALVDRRRLRAPFPLVARLLPQTRPLTRSLRVSNRRLREATGWAPRVRAGTEGWRLAAGRETVAA